MAIVDAKCRFILASVGCPGNSHDSMILQSSRIWQEITSVNVVPEMAKKIGHWKFLHLLLVILHSLSVPI